MIVKAILINSDGRLDMSSINSISDSFLPMLDAP